MTAVKWLSIPDAHLVTQLSCRTATRHTVNAYTHTHLPDPENHEHTRVSNDYKVENGVRASEDELPSSLSIKLPFLCLSSILFWSPLFPLQIQSRPHSINPPFLFLKTLPSLLHFLPPFQTLHAIFEFFPLIFTWSHLCHCLLTVTRYNSLMTAIKPAWHFISLFLSPLPNTSWSASAPQDAVIFLSFCFHIR